MKENKYDDNVFFEKYSNFPRSVGGLPAAGEWYEFQKMLPGFKGKRVLDLGCGFGWHCVYAAEQGADSVTGVDISEKMLAVAREKSKQHNVTYIRSAIEDYDYPENAIDAVISSLTFHYVESFDDICAKVNKCLVPGGAFVFSVEHPVFTAQGKQEWVLGENGNPLYWPVDRYFSEGERNTIFLNENVIKYHKTLTTYINGLINHRFTISGICEPMPAPEMLENNSQMKNELRRPMMLIVAAKKEL